MEGSEISPEMIEVWRNLAASEARQNMMQELLGLGVGLADIEEFGLDQQNKLRSGEFRQKSGENNSRKLAKVTVETKLRDEREISMSLRRQVKDMRKICEDIHKKNSKPYRRIMKKLRSEANVKRREMKKIFEDKILHLKRKYRETEDEKIRKIPEALEEFDELSIFDPGKFEEIVTETYEVQTFGNVDLKENEKKILSVHPSFAVLGKLKPGGLEFEQETSKAKLRIQLGKEDEEKLDEEEEMTEEEIRKMDEISAMSRQVFDPVGKIYDDRKRRVTDLKECSRVTLPRPLKPSEEANIEIRSNSQTKIYRDYREKNVDKKDDQECNLTKEEKDGLESLLKKVSDRSIIIMKTDKSSRFVATTEEEYLKMGGQHTMKDRQIGRMKVVELEKTLNNHAICWCKIWHSGENLGHMSRIIASKISKSENRADMYCLYKDHKAEPGKTRPVVTGCSSDTLGLSNGVSDVLESVANSEEMPYEVISSEDMLAATKTFNEKFMERRKIWQERRDEKLKCERCKFEEIYARNHPETEMTREEMKKDLMENFGLIETEDEEYRERLKQDCELCGEGLEEKDLDVCLLGNDVVALFPSIKSKSTGKIVRKRVILSSLKFEGFDWRQGARYVVMNKHLTSDLHELWGILPYRRKTQGVEPGMSNKFVGSVKETERDLLERWVFPNPSPTEYQIRQIMGRVCEIAVRTIFENFSYKFGGETFQQSEGGPIGARMTMACARLVMQDWGESYRQILMEAKLLVDFLRGYVDDGRQVSTILAQGMRFSVELMKFVITEEGLEEDKISTESNNARMARLCLPAMNAINCDLVFTMEIPEDFPLCKLPTLDFEMWLEWWGINHTYFEKLMKTPYLLMQRSAMGEQQKASILSNELVRRLSNVNYGRVPKEEILRVIEQFIKQMKNSGYCLKQTREITVCGIKGWKGKIRRREKEGKGFYREGKSTLQTRVRKKLTEKESWYRDKERDEDGEEKDLLGDYGERKDGRERTNAGKDKEKDPKKDQKKAAGSVVKAAMFCPATPHSVLAKELRELEYSLEPIMGHRLKIVERAGTKLQDLLTSSNPWKGKICERDDCMLCESKKRTGKNLKQECTRRNLVYETRCYTCEERERRKIEEEEGKDEKEKTKMMEKIKIFKYVGETARSVYERSREHLSDIEQLKPCSHLLKHLLDQHEGENYDDIIFNLKVIQYCKSSFERQVLESVIIQQERHHNLLNSKAEFNRSAVPRLATKIGESQYKKWEKDNEKDIEKHEILEEKIRNLRKMRNKERKSPVLRDEPPGKRRKIGEERSEWRRTRERERKIPKKQEREKRKEEEVGDERQPRKKKLRQMKIGETVEEARENMRGRYSEFGEEEKWEIYDWEGKMKEYKRELEVQERRRSEKIERAKKLEKSWELMRLCKEFIQKNSTVWKDEEELRRKKKDEEERKMERLREVARKKGTLREKEVQKKITDTLKSLPQEERENFKKREEDSERKEMRNIRENLWKKWRRTRQKDIKKNDDEREMEKMNTLEETLTKLEEMKTRMVEGEKRKEEIIQKEKERRRRWRKEKDADEAKKLVREAERHARKEKQRELEKRWKMMKWLADMVDKNTEKWEDVELGEEITHEEWNKLGQAEKKKILMKKINLKESQSLNVEIQNPVMDEMKDFNESVEDD